MSLLWRRNYQLDDPNNPDTANVPFLMGDKSKGVLFGSDYCMCGARWGIFTLCPTHIRVWGGTQIGQGGGYLTFPSFIPGTESPEHPEGIPHPYAGRPAYLDILDINGNRVPALWIRIEGGDVGAGNGFLPPIAVQSYGVLTTVKHQTGKAPFKCTISAELWEEGPLGEQNTPVRRKIAEVTDIPCEDGKRVHLGQSSYWNSNQSDAGEEITDAWRIPVSKQCLHYEETCVARLDLTVTYTPIGGGTPKKYSVRTPVLVIDLGADAEMGRAFVRPDIFPDEGGAYRGSIGDAVLTLDVGLDVRRLKGPFRSKADALEVYTAHKAKIDAYAERCACPRVWPFSDYWDPPPCPFCEDPGDPDAPEDCVWSFSEWDAIPSNSQELEEQMGGQP
jgi:hypothetical protein